MGRPTVHRLCTWLCISARARPTTSFASWNMALKRPICRMYPILCRFIRRHCWSFCQKLASRLLSCCCKRRTSRSAMIGPPGKLCSQIQFHPTSSKAERIVAIQAKQRKSITRLSNSECWARSWSQSSPRASTRPGQLAAVRPAQGQNPSTSRPAQDLGTTQWGLHRAWSTEHS